MKSHSTLLLLSILTFAGCMCDRTRIVETDCKLAEICGNGIDDTCDGVIDEGCPCIPGSTRACGSSVGTCAEGVQTCEEGDLWSACLDEIAPVDEVCDGEDNDCDGEVDEEGVCLRPQVVCPAIDVVAVGREMILTALAVPDGSPIASVGWSVVSRPDGATGEPKPANTTTTRLTADAEGMWTLQFCATDELGRMGCCETTFEADLACTTPPAPPVSTACGTSWDGRPIVQFDRVPTGLFYELVKDGEVLATAREGHNHVRPPSRIDPGSDLPGTSVTLGVRACRSDTPLCCSGASPVDVRVVSECSTPVPASATNLVFSEYLVNGEGTCSPNNCDCQNGEAIELTNLSNCPVTLDGFHFAYRNNNGSSASYRWMNFGPADVIPPRGVYVAMRNRSLANVCGASLGAPSPGLYGLTISALDMEGDNLCSGWFNNTGGGLSELRIAPGQVSSSTGPSFTSSTAITRIAPYANNPGVCQSTGFDAIDSCGNVVGGDTPTDTLNPNQLGRLWHPCDAVVDASPTCVRD